MANYIHRIFQAQQAKRGGIVRRKVSDIDKFASMAQLEAEVRLRGFHMWITGKQAVILCHRGDLQMIC
jgi:hypothetical protein